MKTKRKKGRNRGRKGGEFEREVCRQLSKWWTGGKRDDIFWRSSQSGGRATQRAKKGLRTYGSYGDIAAMDPIGEPLLKLFTIELKRGRTHSSPGDLLDFKTNNKCHPFVKCLQQAVRSALHAGSYGWVLICRRDHRRAMLYMDKVNALVLKEYAFFTGRPCEARFDIRCGKDRFRFIGVPLDSFLARV